MAASRNTALSLLRHVGAVFIIILAIVCVWIARPHPQRDEAKEQTLDGEQEAALRSNEEN